MATFRSLPAAMHCVFLLWIGLSRVGMAVVDPCLVVYRANAEPGFPDQNPTLVTTRGQLRAPRTSLGAGQDGWHRTADLTAGREYLHPTLGRVRFLGREGDSLTLQRLGTGQRLSHTPAASDRFAAIASPNAGREVRDVLAHDWALWNALRVMQARQEAGNPMRALYAEAFGRVAPGRDYATALRELVAEMGYANGAPREESVRLARELVISASESTREDLIRSGVLHSLAVQPTEYLA